MTATLEIELDPGPLERANAQLVVVPFFEGERPLRGIAGRVDWRLCGRISALLASGKLAGTAGEAVLLQGGGGLRAPLLVALGQGPRADGIDWRGMAQDAVARGIELAARDIALPFPESAPGGPNLRERARLLVQGAAAAAAEARADVQLRVLGPPEAAEALAAAATDRGQVRILVRRSPLRRPPAPGRAPSSTPRPLVK